MHLRGHVGAALLLYAPLGAALTRVWGPALALVGAVVAAGASTLPDADEVLPIAHRGPTHTVWFVAVLSLAAAATGALADQYLATAPQLTIALGLTTAVSLTSHLLADVITPMGIRPFYPLSRWHHSFGVTPSRNPRANTTMLAAGVLFSLAWQGVVLL